MELLKLTKRAILILIACVLGIFYAATPRPQQVVDSRCLNPVNTPSATSLGTTGLAPNPTLGTNPAKPDRPLKWFPSSFGVNKPDYQYLSSGHAGSKGVKVIMHGYKSGAANWMFDDLPVTQDQQYYFSDFYKSNVDTAIEASFKMPDGSYQYETLGYATASSRWANFQTTFTVPVGARTFSVYHYIQSNGYLTTSDYSLRTYNPQGFDGAMLTLTFDDGYESTYRYGLALLHKYNYKSTQFIITKVVGDNRYVTKKQLSSMIAQGHEIASHTVTHDSLEEKSPTDLQVEIEQSREVLEAATHNKVTDFAYPLGVQNKQIDKVVASQYSAARGVESGLNSRDNLNCYNLKSEDIHNNTTPQQVADWIRQAQATHTWLILVYHSVEPDQSTSIGKSLFNVTPERLNSHLKVIKASGIDVKTMAEAVNAVNAKAANKPAPSPKPAAEPTRQHNLPKILTKN